ncbi:MAG: IclR family transcriptional regulator [Armatimonadota bacterium]|nr:IclR family transcriptional regulator [Armatimonadota bacterium]
MARGLQTVDRALRILDVLADSGTAKSLTVISTRAGLHVSTTHRLLTALRDRGFVAQDSEGGPYRIGPEAFRIGSSFLEEIDLGPRLRSVLLDLAARTGETANLVVRHGMEAVYVDHVISPQVATLFTRIGQRVPLHCTAVGKVLLAFAAPHEADRLWRKLLLQRSTPYTLTSRQALVQELRAVRSDGYAVDREEQELGVACVAAPVCDASGRTVAAMGISGPAGRVLVKLQALAGHVRSCASRASRLLGCRPPAPALAATSGARRSRRKGGDSPPDLRTGTPVRLRSGVTRASRTS